MNTRAPSFPWSISLGNVIQIVTTLAIVAGAFYTTAQRSETNSRDIASAVETVENMRRKIDSDVTALDHRTRRLEQDYARSDERLTNIFALLSRIDQRMERLEEKIEAKP